MRAPPLDRIAALLFVLCIVSAFSGTAYAARDLYLEVYIDGHPTDLIAAFHEDDAGRLSATADELRQVGLRPPGGSRAETQVFLDALAGVGHRYSPQDQTISFTTSAEDARVARVLEATPADAPPPNDPATGAERDVGVVVNYALGTAGHYDDGNVSGFDQVAGQLDARLSSGLGTLTGDALVTMGLRGSAEGEAWQDRANLTRLNTAWSFADRKRRMAYRVGDIVGGGLSWTRPLRLGGVQVSRDLSIRPDLVTVPLPHVSGSAAVPSSVEVLVNGASVFRGSVPAGPFEISDVPVPAGRSAGKLVVEDALGNTIEQDVTLATTPNLLARGLFEFSAEAGLPRRGYGISSFDYDTAPVASATGRVGVSDWLTLEAHAEGGVDILNGGLGAVAGLGSFGAVEAAVAGSHAEGRQGALVSAGLRLEHALGLVNLRTQRRLGDYEDVASVTAVCALDDILCGDVPLAIDQVSLSLGPAIAGFDTSLSYARVVTADEETSELVTLGVSRPMWNRSNLSLRGIWERQDNEFSIYGGFSMPLGDWGHASLQMDSSDFGAGVFGGGDIFAPGGQGRRMSLSVSQLVPTAQGLSARGHISRDEDTTAASFGASYEGAKGRILADLGGRRTLDGRLDGTVRLAAEGALVVMDGIHATRRIDDAFAVVDTGLPGVTVLRENREVGVTGRRGRLVIPDLRGLESNRIAISPDGLPAHVALNETEAMLVPHRKAGLRKSFRVSTGETSALAIVVDEKGEPLPVGTSGVLNGTADIMIGYDGETWLDGLASRNVIEFRRDAGSSCRAEFPFGGRNATQTHLGTLVCVGHGQPIAASASLNDPVIE